MPPHGSARRWSRHERHPRCPSAITHCPEWSMRVLPTCIVGRPLADRQPPNRAGRHERSAWHPAPARRAAPLSAVHAEQRGRSHDKPSECQIAPAPAPRDLSSTALRWQTRLEHTRECRVHPSSTPVTVVILPGPRWRRCPSCPSRPPLSVSRSPIVTRNSCVCPPRTTRTGTDAPTRSPLSVPSGRPSGVLPAHPAR